MIIRRRRIEKKDDENNITSLSLISSTNYKILIVYLNRKEQNDGL